MSQAFLSMYCAPGCGFQDATLDGKPQGLELARERGLSVFSTYVQTAPGTTSELALQLQRPDAWTGDELGGTYLSGSGAADGPADAGNDLDPGATRDGHRRRHAGHARSMAAGRRGRATSTPCRTSRSGSSDPVGRLLGLLSTPVFGTEPSRRRPDRARRTSNRYLAATSIFVHSRTTSSVVASSDHHVHRSNGSPSLSTRTTNGKPSARRNNQPARRVWNGDVTTIALRHPHRCASAAKRASSAVLPPGGTSRT